MTEEALLAAVVSAIEACDVDKRAASDVLRHQPVPDMDAPLDERAFLVLPVDIPTRRTVRGHCTRVVTLVVAIAYSWTGRADARAMADGRLVADALEGLPAAEADIARVTIDSTAIDRTDTTITSTLTVEVEYKAG